MDEKLNDKELHSAGATVRHKSPFANLDSYVNSKKITQEFREEWVMPFYFELNNDSEDWIKKMISLKPNISDEIILQNLGDFDWRTRSTGSYFASIMESRHFEDIIGIHLLKSEVCYAGSEYAFTIASFNTDKSSDYLIRYLDYYLKNPQLYFDQEDVLCALKYLDEINGTAFVDAHLEDFKSFNIWSDIAKINQLNELKDMVPDKEKELDEAIAETELDDGVIDTSGYVDAMETLNRIIEG